MSVPEFDIRPLRTREEYRDAEILQRAIWQMPDDLEIVPLALLVTAQKNGGLVLGAFEGPRQVGMLFGFLGRTRDGRLKHCSHMMGVLPSHRGHGIAQLLKQRQQAIVRAQGIDLITWTYDPLETVNAMLNIGRLGVICRTYLRNVYGEMSDELNRGLPTDRFEVEWWADSSSPYSPRDSAAEPHRSYLEHIPNTAREVRAPLLGEAPEEAPAGFLPANEIVPSPLGLPAPGRWQIVEGQGAAVAVPGNFQRLKARDLDLAQAWRLHSRAVFEAYFAAGFVVIDFLRRGTGDDSIGVYLLARTEHTAPGT